MVNAKPKLEGPFSAGALWFCIMQPPSSIAATIVV
jgi:hypothetical protein